MTLPRPIVAYHKRASDHPDPFGPWCKLHHAFFTHLAEARLSGAAYKVVIQVLCASFHFGQYHPAALSLDQFQRNQHLGRKAVIEGLRQAVARGILYEESQWQAGTHAPKQYGLVFYRTLVEDSGGEDHSFQHQRMTLLRGGALPCSASASESDQALFSQASGRSGSKSELPCKVNEELEASTGAESEPVLVRQPHQKQCGNRTTTGTLTEPEAAQQRRGEAGSDAAQEGKEGKDKEIPSASLMTPSEGAGKRLADQQEEQPAPFQQEQPPSESYHLPSDYLADEIATLRKKYQRRQAALAAWCPHGVEQIQAKIAERLEVRRLEQHIEELEAALASQDQRAQSMEGICAVGQPDEISVFAAKRASAPEHPSAQSLQVTEEQLAFWRADVAAQQRAVTRLRTQYQDVTEQLQHCHLGKGNWGALVREQRFLAGELTEQEAQLARYERFVALIEHGATKDEACEQLLGLPTQATAAEDCVAEERTPAEDIPEDQASEASAEPAPRLQGQKLRQALFTVLAQMFTNGDPRLIELERGKFNRAIKNLVAVDVQPGDLPVLQATFERLWPKATCTALGLANNLSILIDKARMFGWQLR